MAKVFLKELRWQLEAVNERIAEIKDHGKTDAFGTTIRPKEREEYRKLQARRRALRNQIIHFNP